MDADALRVLEQRRATEARGGVAPQLEQILATTAPDGRLEVVFWLRADDAPDFRQILEDAELAGMSGEDARRYARELASAFFWPRNAAFAQRLAAAGFDVTLVADMWPNVAAWLPARSVRAWAADPAVDMAYHAAPVHMPELDDAQNTMRTPTVWDRGVTCVGSPVKVLVNDVGDVSSSNPYLPTVIKLNTYGVDSHSTAVAGNIAMNHPTYKGAAWGLPVIYSGAGASNSATPPVWSSAIAQGVSFGNCSWWTGEKGSIAYLDRFFDYTIRTYAVMMFKSTGNQGTTGAPYTTTPGNGYNMTNSGAYNDGNSANWSGDYMADYSSYWDPVEGHEKPELANAGDGVDTAGTSSPWIYYGFSGTSSASPLTCGVAALMATRDNTLMTRPEAVKAVLMVSAWHNIEGDDVLSEKDGAGGVHAAAADAVLRDGQYVYGTLTPGSFQNNVYDVPFTAYQGDETRVIALWFSSANSSYTTDVLNMDLDAAVLDPGMAVVAASANAKNPFEILKFTPAVTGTYTLRLSKIRFNGTSERFCAAWSSRMDMAQAEVSVAGTPSIGATVTLTFRDRYDPSVWYQGHVSGGTLPSVVPLGGGWALPLLADVHFARSATWSGFAGTLNASGVATTAVTIPNRSSLVGRTFYGAMYTKPSSGSTAIRTVSEALAVTVLP